MNSDNGILSWRFQLHVMEDSKTEADFIVSEK